MKENKNPGLKKYFAIALMFGIFLFSDFAFFRNCNPINFKILGAEPENSTDWFMEISIQSDGITLKDFLDRFSKTYHFSYFLDRRIDPRMILTCSIERTPFLVAIKELARQNELSFCVYDSILYIGPQKAAGELLLSLGLFRQNLDEHSKLKTQQLLRKMTFKSEEFSSPKELLEQLLNRTDWHWEMLDKMPFDCWNRLNLPNIAICDMIGLILIGFDVRLEIDQNDSSILKPKSLNTEISRYYLPSEISMNDETRFPQCRFFSNHDSTQIQVDGLFRDVASVEYFVAENRMKSAIDLALSNRNSSAEQENVNGTESQKNSKNSFQKIIQITADIKNKSLADIFKALEKELSLTFQLDSSLSSKGISLETKISCRFKNASQEKIVNMIAKKINAKYRIEDQKVLFYSR